MRQCFKYRLFTNYNQERELDATLESHRRLYNQALDERQFCFETAGASLSFVFQSKRFTILRQSNPYYARLNVSSAQKTLRRLDKAFQRFFDDRTVGYPHFKSVERFRSFRFDMGGHGGGCRIVDGKLRLQHIGTIRVRWHRPLPDDCQLKQATIIRDADKWFVCFVLEVADPDQTTITAAVGIDVGLEAFLTTSDGKREPNPRYLKHSLPHLRRVQRIVSRRTKGSHRRRKAVRRLARIHARVRNQRREHQYQVACRLVRRYGIIVAERLSVANMLRNRKLSRAIHDAAWSAFLGVLSCQARKAGAQFVAVDPRGTSQQCTCGADVPKRLSDRWHHCPACGLSLHRDHVSAQVILARGLAGISPAEYKFGSTRISPKSRRLQATE